MAVLGDNDFGEQSTNGDSRSKISKPVRANRTHHSLKNLHKILGLVVKIKAYAGYFLNDPRKDGGGPVVEEKK
ncbi:MAG: hypothetical protein Q9173_006810 [Seirophora scorigena]